MKLVGWLGLVSLASFGCNGSSSTGALPPQAPPPNAVGGFSIELPSVTLQPGDEVTPCYLLPLEIMGPSHIVGGARLTTGGPGMHHGNVVTRRKTGDGIRSCDDEESSAEAQAIDVLNGGAVLFGSTTQLDGTEWQSFPAGIGYRIRDNFEIVARMHYLNTTQNPIKVQPRYDWFTIDESTLVHEVAPFAWSYDDFEIPPDADYTAKGSCLFTDAMHIVSVLPHMHKLGTAFQAGFIGGPRDGQLFLDSPGYDPENSVIRQYDPALDLSDGSGAWFSCSWHNTFDKPISYGIGDNEMCILFGYAWPPANSFTTVIRNQKCVVLGAGSPD
jgi:hypothetical protein